jgi:NAD(P)-dependent dehydrogenase (short-subunit alcohol dehydrogenase family)
MLTNKIIVVTGGLGLIGKAFVDSIIEQNGTPVIADIIEKPNSIGSGIEYIQMDITSKESVQNAILYLDKKYSRIDAVINNAYPRNKNYGKHFFDVEYSDFVENLGLNLGGYFLTSQQFAKYFKKQNFGNIINISSIYGVIAPKFEIYNNTKMTVPIEYSAIKSALIHITQYMAKYFKGYNIRVNAISPGGIFDNQPDTFLKKYKENCITKGMLNQDDLKGVTIFLLSDMSRYVNGQNIVVDDGFSL